MIASSSSTKRSRIPQGKQVTSYICASKIHLSMYFMNSVYLSSMQYSLNAFLIEDIYTQDNGLYENVHRTNRNRPAILKIVALLYHYWTIIIIFNLGINTH